MTRKKSTTDVKSVPKESAKTDAVKVESKAVSTPKANNPNPPANSNNKPEEKPKETESPKEKQPSFKEIHGLLLTKNSKVSFEDGIKPEMKNLRTDLNGINFKEIRELKTVPKGIDRLKLAKVFIGWTTYPRLSLGEKAAFDEFVEKIEPNVLLYAKVKPTKYAYFAFVPNNKP